MRKEINRRDFIKIGAGIATISMLNYLHETAYAAYDPTNPMVVLEQFFDSFLLLTM